MSSIPLSELLKEPLEYNPQARLALHDRTVLHEYKRGAQWFPTVTKESNVVLNALLSRHAEMLEAQFKERIERLESALTKITELDPLDSVNLTLTRKLGEPMFSDRETKKVCEAAERVISAASAIALTALEEKS